MTMICGQDFCFIYVQSPIQNSCEFPTLVCKG